MSKEYFAVALRRIARAKVFSILERLKLLTAVLVFILASSPASAYPQFVQEKSLWDGNSYSTMSVTLTNAQVAGDFLYVAVGWGNATATINSVSDSRGNTYTLATGPFTISGTARQSVYYAKNIAAAAAGANTVTIVFSASVPSPSLRVLHFTGVDRVNPVDVISTQTGTGGGPETTFDYVTATSDGVLLAAGYTDGGLSSPGDGMLELSGDGRGFVLCAGAGVGAGLTYPIIASGGGTWWIVQSVVFKQATSPPASPTAGSVTYQYDSFGRLKQVTVTPH